MKEFEKSNVVRQGSPFNSALVFTFTAFSSSAVSETCISRWTTQFSFYLFYLKVPFCFWSCGQKGKITDGMLCLTTWGEQEKKSNASKLWFCHIVVLVRSSEWLNMHLCLTEFVSYVPEQFSPSVCLLEESSFHTSLCKLQRFKASMQKLVGVRRWMWNHSAEGCSNIRVQYYK